MRWLIKVSPPRPEWEPCFAWVPHIVGDSWVWLEPLERRFVTFRAPYVVYEYRLRREYL